MRSTPLDNYPWLTTYFRPIAVIIMIMCINVALIDLAELVEPNWSGTYFLIGMLFVTIEGLYAHKAFQNRYFAQPTLEVRYRLAEWAIILVCLRLLAFADQSLSEIQAEIIGWWYNPMTFGTFEYAMMVILAFAAWMISTEVVVSFDKLYDPDERAFTQSALADRFFTGGGILVAVTGFTLFVKRWGPIGLTQLPSDSINGNIFNVLLYFMVGLLLLSQITMTKQLIRWQKEGMIISTTLVRKWIQYSLLLLAGLTIAVFFLPTTYTLGLLQMAGLVLVVIFNICQLIAKLVLVIITLPFLMIFMWLQGDQPTSALPSMTDIQLPTETVTSGDMSWLDILQSVLFWGVAILIAVYLIKIYLHDHQELVQYIRQFKFVQLFRAIIGRLWHALLKLFRRSTALIPTRLGWGDFSFRKGNHQADKLQKGQTPRDHIRYYYLTLLAQLDEHGLRRRSAQTPYEYEPNLQQAIPTAEQEAHELTQLFVNARYSQTDFSSDDVAFAQAQANRIKNELEAQQQAPEPTDET